MRAKLKRDGISVYGFRIAEPQHDGTPHWHLLLFMEHQQTAKVSEIFRHYALQVDGDEPGAKKHRFKAIAIDKSKGTAAGSLRLCFLSTSSSGCKSDIISASYFQLNYTQKFYFFRHLT